MSDTSDKMLSGSSLDESIREFIYAELNGFLRDEVDSFDIQDIVDTIRDFTETPRKGIEKEKTMGEGAAQP
jgi:hypothetical protein